MDKLGFSYEKLKEINPRIIFASATGYGPVGPNAKRPGQDMVAQAVTGFMYETADPSIPQSIVPTAICDYTGGMHLCQGIMAALIGRDKTGLGRKVDVCLYDSMIRYATAGSGLLEQIQTSPELGGNATRYSLRGQGWTNCGDWSVYAQPAKGYVRCIRNR